MTRAVRLASVALVGVGVALAAACGSDPIVNTSECVPGEASACGGSTCSKVCGPDGKYGACTCVDASVIDSGPDAPPDVGVEAEAEAEAAVEAGPITWGHAFAAPDGRSYSVAIDKNQNVFVGGKGTGVGAGLTKLSATGNVLWEKTIQWVTTVAVDSSGAVYGSGISTGNVDFGAGVVVNGGAFIVKYDANGAYQWLEGPFPLASINGIAVRANGNVVAFGALDGSTDFGSGAIAPTGIRDALLLELSPTKTVVRQKHYGVDGATSFQAGALDANDNLFLAGTFEGTSVSFGGASIPQPNQFGQPDEFVVKLDPSLAPLKQTQGNATSNDINAMATDALGRVYIGGTLTYSIQFGTTPTACLPNQTCVYVGLLDANLSEVWAKRFVGLSGQTLNGLAADPAGGVVVTGWTRGNLNFGLPGMPSVEAGYVARFDGTGKAVSNQGFVVPNGQATGWGVAHLTGADFVVAGECTGGSMALPSGPVACPIGDVVGFAARLVP